MTSGSSPNITQWSIYLYYHSATVIFILHIKYTKISPIFLVLNTISHWLFLPKTKKMLTPKYEHSIIEIWKTKVNYLSLYSGWSMHHCSHSGIRHPQIACCSTVVPSSQAHLSKYGNSRSMLYHGCNLLLSFLCFDLCFLFWINGNLCDNLYL